jgi:hypothetical protein
MILDVGLLSSVRMFILHVLSPIFYFTSSFVYNLH